MANVSKAEKILYHATEMFAHHGFAGTIMDELASLAQVNKATIYYHFKDKEHLYEEVVSRRAKVLLDSLTLAVAKQTEVLEKLKAYILTFAGESEERSLFFSIMMREIAGGGHKMPNPVKVQMHKILLLLKSILEQGFNEGLFIKANVLTVHFMIIGSLSFYITSEPMRKMMTSPDADIHSAFVDSTVTEVSQELFMMVKNALLKNTKENV